MRTSLTVSCSASLAVFMLLACSGRHAGDESDSMAAALISDNDEIASLEQDLEGSLEQPLSGASSELAEIDADSESEAAEAARSNAGLYFKPAGCITSTRDGNLVTHAFDDCTGPRGRTLNGTVTSTWSRTDSGVSVLHEAADFYINGAVVDHATNIAYEHVGGVYTKKRTSSTVGETARGRDIDHAADFEIVFDSDSKCFERNGSAEISIGDRDWNRQIDGWLHCGGWFACPSAGTISFSGPRGEATLEITASGLYDITINGRTDTDRRMLWCRAE